MKRTVQGDGVTTYIYGPEDQAATVMDVRNAVERIEVMCRDILTVLTLLTELLSEANERPDESGDSHL